MGQLAHWENKTALNNEPPKILYYLFSCFHFTSIKYARKTTIVIQMNVSLKFVIYFYLLKYPSNDED